MNKTQEIDKLYQDYYQKIPIPDGYSPNIVTYRGSVDTSLMIVGEAPGANEDAQGLPFVGRSGALLDRYLADYNLAPYITNAVKSRPPNNRTPTSSEIGLYISGLFREIDIVQPRYIITLGATATNAVYGLEGRISDMVNKEYRMSELLILPNFHPAYIMRQKDTSKAARRFRMVFLRAGALVKGGE